MKFFLGAPEPCSYLPDHESRMAVLDPAVAPQQQAATTLSQLGFRRSGSFLYRPHCPGCKACIACRVDVEHFQPRRRHKRTMKTNADLSASLHEPQLSDEQHALFLRYQRHRHPGTSMANPDRDSCSGFFECAWSDTQIIEWRDGNNTLVAAAVVDYLKDGLSAVYSFFDPDLPQRSLGNWAVLWQIDYAKRLNLPWVYLGYWISGCDKMNYKDDFQPLQGFFEERWQPLNSSE